MSQLILRNEALAHCALLDKSKYRILLIQAQAGQGKTVLATQFDEISETPFAWTTCTQVDTVPGALFGKIVRSMATALPSFSEDIALGAMQQQLSMDEFVTIAPNSIASQLEAGGTPVTLVIDDAHLLEESPESKKLIHRLIRCTPEYVQFVFLTRFPLSLDGKPLLASNEILEIDSSLLAFSREEIAILFNEAFGISTDSRKVNQLFQATEGWVAGLMLLRSSGTIQRLTGAEQIKSLGSYFDELMVPSLTQAEQREMFLLSLLDEIPEALLCSLSSGDVVKWVESMVEKNCFARARMEGEERVFRLHHLFQDYLSWQGDEQLSAKEKSSFLVSAGTELLDAGKVLDGLRYYTKAEAWEKLSSTLKIHSVPLLAANAHQPLMEILSAVPEETRWNSPWLCFAHGATLLTLDPAHSAPTMIRAVELCEGHEEKVGELLAICSLLNFHILISGEFGRKAALVDRAEQLFKELRPQLPDALVGNCAQAISLGKAYYENKLIEADEYSIIGGQAFRTSSNINPWLIITRILILALKGDVKQALDLLSPYHQHTNTPWISPTTRFSVLILQANYQLMAGQFTAYRALRDTLRRDWPEFLEHSYLGIFVSIWDLDMLTQEGRYDEILQRVAKSPCTTDSYPSHMTSQLKHYEMLAYAHLGRFEEMDMAMREALRLRAKGGAPYFIHLTHSLAMGALSLAGRHSAAERVFAKCTKASKTAPSLYHSPTVYAYRAAMYLKNDKFEEAKEDVRSMLEHMVRFNNSHFFGWAPDIMKPVLSFAVKEGIHSAYAKELACKQMACDILDDGEIVPHLKVQTIGEIRLSYGLTSSSGTDLTPMEQRIIELLAFDTQSATKLPDIQTLLWPKQDPAETRSNIDTNLSRLRSKTTKIFGKGVGKRHLQTEGQRVRLAHCSVDCDRIMKYAQEGLSYPLDEKPWHVHIAFLCMAKHLGENFENPIALQALPKHLVKTVSDALLKWVQVLKLSNAPEEALGIADKALMIDPIDDTFQRERYDLLTSLKRPREAAQSLKDYRLILSDHDFTDEEIDNTIDNLLASTYQ